MGGQCYTFSLFWFWLNLSNAEVLKGFHFNKNQEQLWTVASDELKKNQDWYFNFSKYGNCLRMEIPPFALPKQLTLCYKVNHDVSDTFHNMNLVSTKTGGSAIDELKEHP